jgi:iron complex transport system substrate-binding protein
MNSHTPRRIVSLQPSATVILHALGLLDRVVACTKYCLDVCPEAASQLLIVADSWTAQASQILAARPDLVIAAVPYQEQSVSEILKSGIRFLGLAPHTLADIYGDIMTIAGVTGSSESGESLILHMQAGIEIVHHATETLDTRTVFCEEWGKPLIASQPWVAELIAAAGGRMICDPGRQIDPETIRAADPDVLIAAWCGAGDRVPLEKIIRGRNWTQIKAVRQRQVYCIPDEWLNTPAPTLLNGLYALAAAIHPERFPSPSRLRRITDAPTPMSDQAPAL